MTELTWGVIFSGALYFQSLVLGHLSHPAFSGSLISHRHLKSIQYSCNSQLYLFPKRIIITTCLFGGLVGCFRSNWNRQLQGRPT